MDVYFKQEYLQVTGSFKERGARYALKRLTPKEKQIGVIAASAGKLFKRCILIFYISIFYNYF